MSRDNPTPEDAKAEWAFEAHAAMMRTEAEHPELGLNPYWQALRGTAHARFRAAFEVAK